MKRLISVSLCVVLCLAGITNAAATTRPSESLRAGNHLRKLEVDGRERSYLVYVPAKLDLSKPAPLVLIFHGAGMNALTMAWYSGLNRKADQAGFIAVYPNGTGAGDRFLTFNAWAAPTPGPNGRADDVGFTRRILDDLSEVAKIDPKRIYATGMSNGGFMCYRLAVEMSDRIAAIAPVAGTLAVPAARLKRPVPVIHFHGTADTLVPFNGPVRRIAVFLAFKSVDETIRTFAKLDGCPEQPQVTELPDSADDGTRVMREIYGPGEDGAEVVLYTVENGGHTWPGRPGVLKWLGKSTSDISANDLIWDFFVKHPMK